MVAKQDIAPILVGVDFSEDSRAALEWAFGQSALISAPVVVLHVIHDPAESPGFYNKSGESALLPIEDVAAEKMEEFLSAFPQAREGSADPGLVERAFAKGLPAGRIAEVAMREGAQLIVIGTRGRTGLSNLILGSVAERVLQIATAPVVVVKADHENEEPSADK